MNKIEQIRKEIGISKSDLSLRSGLSVGYICHLEKGTRSNPSYTAMKKIAGALNRNIADVF